MTVDVRLIRPDEGPAFARSVALTFLDAGNDELDHWGPHLEPTRTWVCVERDRVVGTSCVYTRDLTVPGLASRDCPAIPLTAISGVGVHPTHRRQGLLRRMMKAMLDDGRSRGEAVAGLLASEAGIYGRFGFGPATTIAELHIDCRDRALRAGSEPSPIDVELLDLDQAAKVVPALHDRLRRLRCGQVQRNDATWAEIFADHPARRGGMSGLMCALSDGGYALYRGRERSDRSPRQPGRLQVRDLYGQSADVEAALWSFLLQVDLVDEVVAAPRPVDEAFRWRLANPRALRVARVTDFLWLRILDVPAALGARCYQQEGRLVLDVVEGSTGGDPVVGRWVLEGGPQGAQCRPARPSEASDVSLGVEELGAIYLGGVTLSSLAAAGRAVEERAGALAAADRLFATSPSPFSGTGF